MAEPVRRRRGYAVLIASVLLAAVGCTSGREPAPLPATTTTSAGPGAVRAAVQATVDAVNAAAAGDVAAQQAVFARVVDPARAAEQAACAPATLTIRIDPVLDSLRTVPASAGPGASASAGTGDAAPPVTGARYRLPALLEVYTGPIRTGTDLTGLEFTFVNGVAHTAPLCLN